ncbi:MAG TPA: hypothetical protein VGO16_09405 [Pseudonocardiaceae bacterium]|jgi:hypothetical protein|nr:hypothetical protein [Pseudonocardiaceae bacterium]
MVRITPCSHGLINWLVVDVVLDTLTRGNLVTPPMPATSGLAVSAARMMWSAQLTI